MLFGSYSKWGGQKLHFDPCGGGLEDTFAKSWGQKFILVAQEKISDPPHTINNDWALMSYQII